MLDIIVFLIGAAAIFMVFIGLESLLTRALNKVEENEVTEFKQYIENDIKNAEKRKPKFVFNGHRARRSNLQRAKRISKTRKRK